MLLKFYDSNAGVSFAESAEAEGLHMFLAFQVVVDAGTQRSRSLAVDDADAGEMSQSGVV